MEYKVNMRIVSLLVVNCLLLVGSYIYVSMTLKNESNYLVIYDVVSIWLPIFIIFFSGILAGLFLNYKRSGLVLGGLTAFGLHFLYYIVATPIKMTEKMKSFLFFYAEQRDSLGTEVIVNHTWGIILQGYFTELLLMVFLGSIGGWIGKRMRRKVSHA